MLTWSSPGEAFSDSNPKATSQRMRDPDGIRTFTVISDIFLTKEPTIFQLKSGEHLILSSLDPWEGGPLHQLQLKCNITKKVGVLHPSYLIYQDPFIRPFIVMVRIITPFTPWKINGWNLQITHLKKGNLSEPNLHGYVPTVNLQGCMGYINGIY